LQSYFNKNGSSDDLIFITVLYKDNSLAVADMAKKAGYTFPILVDDGVVSSIYGIKGPRNISDR